VLFSKDVYDPERGGNAVFLAAIRNSLTLSFRGSFSLQSVVKHTQLTRHKFVLPFLSPREKVLRKCLSKPLRAGNLAYGLKRLGVNQAKAKTQDMAPDFGFGYSCRLLPHYSS
jgi:hypothetical protein